MDDINRKKKDESKSVNDLNQNKPKTFGRRDLLKGLITVPVLGAFLYGLFKKKQHERYLKGSILDELKLDYEAPVVEKAKVKSSGKLVRLGIIGFGGRGESLVRSSGFAHPEAIDRLKEAASKNSQDKRYEDYKNQEDLNIVYNGVCDLFEVRTERALAASGNLAREGSDAQPDRQVKRYKNYKDLLASDDIDAVIIATPDHWHARMIIDAANAGKHVYVEKAMTRTIEETFKVVDAVKKNGITFQLGHQGRQTESYLKAKEIIQKNILGKISLIEVTTNRNTPNGAWVYKIHKKGSPETIDWEQFQGPAPNKVPFSLERFFRWRCWFDYGTGLSGDLLTHEYDAINQIMELGIPETAVASGGIYFYKDGRDVPDVFQVVYEYPDKDLTLIYSATLSNERERGKVIMGHDAAMELGNNLIIMPDPSSTRYKDKIENGIIDLSLPLFSYQPGLKRVDAITSATQQYFAGRGLMYTYKGGKRVDTTFLHIKEWLGSIRNGTQPSCNIDQGFQEAITAHMATLSYLEGRKITWDAEKKIII